MRVLVVEDEPELLRVLAQALREEGYAVDEADNGPDAVVKATNGDYDAVLLDLMPPGLDGWQVLARLRKTRPTPVLILTARDAVDDRIRGLDYGADDYVVKPFNLAEVLARVRALIRRSAGRADSSIAVGDVTIDTRSRTVTKAGDAVVLTAREYAGGRGRERHLLRRLAGRRHHPQGVRVARRHRLPRAPRRPCHSRLQRLEP